MNRTDRLAARLAAEENLYQGKPFKVVKRGGKNSRILLDGASDSQVVPNHELWPDQFSPPQAPKKKPSRGTKPKTPAKQTYFPEEDHYNITEEPPAGLEPGTYEYEEWETKYIDDNWDRKENLKKQRLEKEFTDSLVPGVPREHQEAQNAGKVFDWYDQKDPNFVREFLGARGFKIADGYDDDPADDQHSPGVKSWVNPYTGQRATVSIATKNNRGKNVQGWKPKATLSFNVLKENRAKRRTPEQKYRDNFVLYD